MKYVRHAGKNAQNTCVVEKTKCTCMIYGKSPTQSTYVEMNRRKIKIPVCSVPCISVQLIFFYFSSHSKDQQIWYHSFVQTLNKCQVNQILTNRKFKLAFCS